MDLSSEVKQKSVTWLRNKNDIFLNVGRQKESPIFLRDISVSRNHAKLWVYHDQLFVYDCKSKFGTGVGIFDKFTLMDNKSHKFMIDKCLLTVKMVSRERKCTKSTSHDHYIIDPCASLDVIADIISQLVISDNVILKPKLTEEPEFQIEPNFVTGPLPANLEVVVEKKKSESKISSAILHEITPQKANQIREIESAQKNHMTLNLCEDNDFENESQSNRKQSVRGSALLRKINLMIKERQSSNPSSVFFDRKPSGNLEPKDQSDFKLNQIKDCDSEGLLAYNSNLFNHRLESKESCIYDPGFSNQSLFRFE